MNDNICISNDNDINNNISQESNSNSKLKEKSDLIISQGNDYNNSYIKEDNNKNLSQDNGLYRCLSDLECYNKDNNQIQYGWSQKNIYDSNESNKYYNHLLYNNHYPFKPYFYPNPAIMYQKEADKINNALLKHKELAKREEKINIANRGRQITMDKNKLLFYKQDQIEKRMEQLSKNYYICLQRKNNPYNVVWEKYILKNKYASELKIKKYYNCLPQYKAPFIKKYRSYDYAIKDTSVPKKKTNKIDFPIIYKYFTDNNQNRNKY